MDLEFGTAGLRGVIGAGTNRMNIYTVRKATQGLANYICKVGAQAKGVAIAYDSRHMSPEFADSATPAFGAFIRDQVDTQRFRVRSWRAADFLFGQLAFRRSLLLLKRIPAAAVRTSAEPARGFIAALTAYVHCFCFCHNAPQKPSN